MLPTTPSLDFACASSESPRSTKLSVSGGGVSLATCCPDQTQPSAGQVKSHEPTNHDTNRVPARLRSGIEGHPIRRFELVASMPSTPPFQVRQQARRPAA